MCACGDSVSRTEKFRRSIDGLKAWCAYRLPCQKFCAQNDVFLGVRVSFVLCLTLDKQIGMCPPQQQLDNKQMISSMSYRGQCWDNASAESFWAIQKRESLPTNDCLNLEHKHKDKFIAGCSITMDLIRTRNHILNRPMSTILSF